MNLLFVFYKFIRNFCLPLWNLLVYGLCANTIEYFIVTRLDDSCVMLPIYDESDLDELEVQETDDVFVMIRYTIYTTTSSKVFYKVLRDNSNSFSEIVSMHGFDSLQFSNCSFIDCQTANEDDCHQIQMTEFSLVSNELFFDLFNEWLWMYYLNTDYLPNTVTTLIDTNVNVLSLKNTYIKLEKDKYIVMDDNEDNNYVTICQDKKND